MEESDKYIDYEAYVRYLRKVTGEPDAKRIMDAVLAKAEENTELQVAHSILKRLAAAVVIVLFLAICFSSLGFISASSEADDGRNLWEVSRVKGRETKGAMRLYDAYEHSQAFRK